MRTSKAIEQNDQLREVLVQKLEIELQHDEVERCRDAYQTDSAYYRELFELAPAGYVILQGDQITHANRAAGELVALPTSELIDKRFSSFVAPSSTFVLREHLRKLLVSQEPQSCVLGLVAADGTRRTVRLQSISTVPVSARWRTMMVDVTDELKGELRTMTTESSFKGNPAFRSLAHDLSHLFMRIIVSADTALARLETGHGARTQMAALKTAAVHGSETMSELLDFEQSTQLRAADLNHVIKRAEPLVRQIVGETTRLEIETSAKRPQVEVGTVELTRMLLNLASSARAGMNEESNVLRIATRDAEDEPHSSPGVVLSMTSNGSRPESELREVDAVVQRAGGQLTVNSAPNRGTSVEVLLPRSAAARN